MAKSADDGSKTITMKVLVYKRPNFLTLKGKPKPTIINSTDAVLQITTDTICETGLHILPEIIKASDTFANAAKKKTLKVVIKNMGIH
ncbi:MAG: hypothetical protein HQM08_07650 [Candidatus Riflebacteria bacterium]|nr:hypothetical protein [Candidatus Riflebacteria bacterium]